MTTATAPQCRFCAACKTRLAWGWQYPVTRGHALRGKPHGEKMYC